MLALVAVGPIGCAAEGGGGGAGGTTEPSPSTSAQVGSDAGSHFALTKVITDFKAQSGEWVAAGCRAEDPGQVWVGVAERHDAGWRTTRIEPVGWGWDCGCPATSTKKVVPDETVVLIECWGGGTSRMSSAFVIGAPVHSSGTGVLLRVECGVTKAVVDGDAVTIESWDPKAGAIWPSPKHPSFRVRWNGNSFSTGDGTQDELLEWFCPAPDSERTAGDVQRVLDGAMPHATPVGAVWTLADVALAAGDTCKKLSDAWWDNWLGPAGSLINGPNPDPQPIATAIGLPPPSGVDDWFFSCFEEVP